MTIYPNGKSDMKVGVKLDVTLVLCNFIGMCYLMHHKSLFTYISKAIKSIHMTKEKLYTFSQFGYYSTTNAMQGHTNQYLTLIFRKEKETNNYVLLNVI